MDKLEQKTEMNICSTNKSDRLSLVMGPSTVPCMMATSPLTSSAPYSAGKGQCNHKPAYRVSVASLEATGRLSMTLASNKQQNKTEGGKHREKRRGEKQNRHKVKTKPDQMGSQELPTYKTLCNIIQKTLHTEIQKRNPLY
jgi:hypothetical protein